MSCISKGTTRLLEVCSFDRSPSPGPGRQEFTKLRRTLNKVTRLGIDNQDDQDHTRDPQAPHANKLLSLNPGDTSPIDRSEYADKVEQLTHSLIIRGRQNEANAVQAVF